jgi:hypothetical protein
LSKHLSKLAIVLCLTAPLVFARNDRSWVSSTGSDSNPCTRTMPCATFQTAINQTNSGGEVDVVDAGDYGTVHLTFPITIDGGGMARISIGSNIFGVNVSETVSGPIIVRNLSITGSPGTAFSTAFFMAQCGACVSAYEVHVENVDIANVSGAFGMQDVGIVTIKGSTIHGVTGAIGVACAGTVGIPPAITVEIRDVVITTTAANGFAAVQVCSGGTVTIDKSSIANSYYGIGVVGTGTVRLSDSTITGNSFGLFTFDGGTIISFVNNRIYGNQVDGAPTKSVYQR